MHIVCSSGVSSPVITGGYTSIYLNVGGQDSCYARYRYSRSGLQGTYGTEYRNPWNRYNGWSQGYYV